MKRYLQSVLAVGLLASVAYGAGKVPLKFKLPRPLFEGTPRPLNVPNLEPPRAGPRPPLMVPQGTVLLSANKPVTASDSFPVIGDLSFITNGDNSGVDGAYVELGPGLQWAQIDLGKADTIEAIVVWHFHSQARVYHDVIVQVSNDPKFKRGVTTVFNNDTTNHSGLGKGHDQAYIETYEGKLIAVHGVKARYVRLYSDGSTSNELNDYCEVDVFGLPGT